MSSGHVACHKQTQVFELSDFAPSASNSMNTSLLDCSSIALFGTFVCPFHLRKTNEERVAQQKSILTLLNDSIWHRKKKKNNNKKNSVIAHEVEGQEERESSLLGIKRLLIDIQISDANITQPENEALRGGKEYQILKSRFSCGMLRAHLPTPLQLM